MLSPVPKANAMLICDYVITEVGTNKKSLIGIFENIAASQFPCRHDALSVYVKLTEAAGEYRFRLELVDLKGGDKVVESAEMPRPLKSETPLKTHELVFNLRGLKFGHPGEYEFRIYGNQNIFGQKTFHVSQKNQISPS